MSRRPEQVTKVCQLPSRRCEGHKGDYGRVLVVGGSRGMVGAVALASNAALRGGAGLVTFAAPESIQQTVAALCPCATSIPLACKPDGDFAPEAMRQLSEAAEACDVIAAGPGLGQSTQRQNLVRIALEQTRPLILDADGLNNLSRIDGWPARRRCPLVLTPHVGEFARLTGKSAQQIQSARQDAAVAAAREWADQQALAGPPLVCVLKGAGTVVTDGRSVYVNDTGNPGMATGGSGDVLTGLIAAMIAQKLEPFDAACLAVRVHGRAGDLAADEKGQASLIATDLLDYLPAAMKEAIEQ